MSRVLPLDAGGPTDRPFEGFPRPEEATSIGDRFTQIAERTPERTALVDLAGHHFTYRQVHHRSNGIAAMLDDRLGPSREPIAILLEHGCEFPIAMLGVLKSGRPYVPLDARFPTARNRRILEQAKAAFVLGQGGRDFDGVTPREHYHPRHSVTGSDVAYIIYTSGSTGEPKGVFQDHAGVLHDVMQYANAIHFGPDDRSTQLYSPSVSGAIRDIYGTLLTGARLCIFSPAVQGIDDLHAFIEAQGVTILHSVPALFRRFVQTLTPPTVLSSVRLVYLAGDRVDVEDVHRFRTLCPRGSFLYTGIGSTENATLYRHWFIDHDTTLPTGLLPVGRELPERKVTLRGPEGEEVPQGMVGEIHVASRYVALGYWRDEAQTARAFHRSNEDARVRVLRTGDVGRIRADGLLEYLGRADDQLKIRGHRVEPAEVEAAIKGLQGVHDASLVVRGPATDSPALVAYVVADRAVADLKRELFELLPNYAVPSEIVAMPALPLLPNHKVDRRSLAHDAERRMNRDTSHGRSLTATERVIAHEMSRVLGRRVTAADADFFALGGDSLTALAFLNGLQHRMRVLVPHDVLLTASTVSRIARWIGHDLQGERREGAVLIRSGHPERRPLFVLPGRQGTLYGAQILSQRLSYSCAVYGLPDPGFVRPGSTANSIEAMAEYAIAEIQKIQPQGPYRLFGACVGGKVAYEMAHRLFTSRTNRGATCDRGYTARALSPTIGCAPRLDETGAEPTELAIPTPQSSSQTPLPH